MYHNPPSRVEKDVSQVESALGETRGQNVFDTTGTDLSVSGYKDKIEATNRYVFVGDFINVDVYVIKISFTRGRIQTLTRLCVCVFEIFPRRTRIYGGEESERWRIIAGTNVPEGERKNIIINQKPATLRRVPEKPEWKVQSKLLGLLWSKLFGNANEYSFVWRRTV